MIDRTDASVLAKMRAAEQAMQAVGRAVADPDTDHGPDAHLRRAVYWQRYSRGPVPAQQRACAADIARGSLRLWSLAGGVPEPLPGPVAARPVPAASATGIRLARVQLSAQVRARCCALRADLSGTAAGLSRSGIAEFDDLVRREALRVARDLDVVVGERLCELGLSAGRWEDIADEDFLPPRRRPALEHRLTALLGAGFAAGVAITAGRLLAQLRPDWMPFGGLICGLFGVALTAWTIAARRLLAERTAAERWIVDAVANLRAVLDERLITRILLAEVALRGSPN